MDEDKKRRLQVLQQSRPTSVRVIPRTTQPTIQIQQPQPQRQITVSGAAPNLEPMTKRIGQAGPQPNIISRLASSLWQGFQEAPKAAGEGLSLAGKQGEATRASQLKLQEQTTDSILKAQQKLKDPNVSQPEKLRWQNYLRNIYPEAAQRDVETRQTLEKNVKELSPVRQLAAYGSMGFDIATAGVAGQATKQALKQGAKRGSIQLAKALAKDAALAGLTAAPSGALSPVIQKGSDVTAGDIAKGAATGFVTGAALPVVGYGLGRIGGRVLGKITNSSNADEIAALLRKEATQELSQEESEALGRLLAKETDPAVVQTILESVDESAPQVGKTANYLDTNTSQQVLNKNIQPKAELWSRWFKQSDYKALPEIEQDILKNPQIKDAGTSRMYDYYKKMFGEDMTYDEFLNKDITLYRGGKTRASNNMASYSLLERKAKRFGDVSSITVKPKDTYGMLGDFSEGEVFVPSKQVAPQVGKTDIDFDAINKAQDEAKSFMTQMIDKYQPQKQGRSMKITDMMSKSEKAQMNKLNKVADDLYVKSTPPAQVGKTAATDAADNSATKVLPQSGNKIVSWETINGDGSLRYRTEYKITPNGKKTITVLNIDENGNVTGASNLGDYNKVSEKYGTKDPEEIAKRATIGEVKSYNKNGEPIWTTDGSIVPPQTATQALEQAVEETPPSSTISQATPTTAAPEGAPSTSADIAQGKIPEAEVNSKVQEANIQIPNTVVGDSKLSQLRAQAASSLIDDDAVVLRQLREADKLDGGNRVERWMFYTDNVRQSNAMANNYIRNNTNVKQAFDGLDEVGFDEFDKYAAARSELSNVERGLTKTSKDIGELTNIVNSLEATYDERFNALNKYYKDLSLEMYNAGIIDDARLTSWLDNNDYVRIQRDMEDLVNQKFGRSGSRSFRSTSAKQKRTGSVRDILSPSSSAAKRTQEIFAEINRNKIANEAVDIFRELGLAKQVPNSSSRMNTVYRFVNGAQETFEVPREFKEIMDNVNPINLGILKQVVSAPTRALRAGTTSLSAPFAAVNYMRDQLSSFIVSDNVLATHNPASIISGLKNAIQDLYGGNTSELWNKFERYAGDQTVFDELRNAQNTKRLLTEISQGKKGMFKNRITQPVRTLEDLVGVTEKATRFQNFRGVYKKAINDGLTEEQAIIRAVVKARENSVNFSRGTNFLRAANIIYPYFNASTQGTRTVLRAFRDRPVQTVAKTATMVTVPSIALAAYNMSSPENRVAYESLSDFEKDNNFILFTGKPEQRDDGTWTNLIKIPKPQGFRELSNPVEKLAYSFFSKESPENALAMFQHMASGLTGPINIQSGSQLLGSIIPQGLKPAIQAAVNRDFYTGQEIVPDWVSADIEDPTKQAFKGTSGAARYIANALGVSPIKVEKAIYDTFGSLGRYGVNAVDNALAATGKIPEEQIGGRSALTDFSRRMFEARGDTIINKTAAQKHFDDVEAALKEVGLNSTEQKAFESGVMPKKKSSIGEQLVDKTYYDSANKAITWLRYPKTFEVSKAIDAKARADGRPGDPLYDLSPDQLKVVLNLQANYSPGNREEAAIKKLNPWLEDFNKKRSTYFDQIQQSMTPEQREAMGVDPMGIKIPKAAPELQTKLDQVNALTDSAARAQFYADNPEVSDFYQQVNDYQRVKRSFLGLPQFDKYPEPTEEVQSYMDEYNALPKGNGPISKTTGKPTSPARSAWIKANPDKFAAMNEQWSRQDIYKLQQEGSLAVYEGLDFTEEGIKSIQDLAKALGVSSGSYGANGYSKYGSAASDYMSIMKLLSGVVTDLPTAPKISQKATPPKLKFKQPFSGAKPKLRVQLK